MTQRLRVRLEGAVQGVGFRPFIYRLANELHLTGYVQNSSAGLTVEVEGPAAGAFLDRLNRERPAQSVVLATVAQAVAPEYDTAFVIRPSDNAHPPTAAILPDLATCPDCLRELTDPGNRRFRYPFLNCTHCGPRYTIVSDIPYDRPNTTMREFTLCPACQAEYEEPADRRFHAQPTACPACGPRLAATGELAHLLAGGSIVALKGIGGYQLLCDARDHDAVACLRARKHRDEKPFAVMMPDLTSARRYCRITPAEEALLTSQAAPIVLLDPLASDLASNVSGSSPCLGVMLPYSPLHHLLMQSWPHPVVATSGNRSEEPIAIDNAEARARLGAIAGVFLDHDRPIARACDDSVARILRGRPALIRRARGYVPLPIEVPYELPPVLAVGAHLKNTVAIALGRRVVLSQHLGDLETPEARAAFTGAIEDLCRLYRFRPELVACDLHPDYASSQWAQASGLRVRTIQHHHAHAASCAAENGLSGDYLAVCWDGSGYGLDGSIWGGEFFAVRRGDFTRIAHLRPFRLPGGDTAVREGWRSAASLVFDTTGALPPDTPHGEVMERMIRGAINAPVTTSAGRLFDGVASLAGIARTSRFEGQAANVLERAVGRSRTSASYPFPAGDWRPLIAAILEEPKRDLIPVKFHNALVEWIVSVAREAAMEDIVLSGGVFQNRYLTECAAEALEQRGHRVHTHSRVPTNDGGISLGQAVLTAGKV